MAKIVPVLGELGFICSLTEGIRKIKEGAVFVDGVKVPNFSFEVEDGQIVQLGRHHKEIYKEERETRNESECTKDNSGNGL